MKKEQTISIKFNESQLEIIDQTQLPSNEVWIDITKPKDAVQAIKCLKVRGAPLIGVTAALSFGLFCKLESDKSKRLYWWNQLIESRPTAVNLVHLMNQLRPFVAGNQAGDLIFDKAYAFYLEDRKKCQDISLIGLKVLCDQLEMNNSGDKKISLLTHCNTGALATAGVGTALGVIKKFSDEFPDTMTYVDETRPLLQGARLTTWELALGKYKHKLICDNMAGFLMMQKKVDAILVGADRIASNGDSANKIGTYSLAVLAKYHNIPFYIVAPTTTVDSSVGSGLEIPIELRKPEEVQGFVSTNYSRLWANSSTEVYNPAFDWAPADLITGWITEQSYFNLEDVKGGIFKKYQKSGAI